MDLIKKGGWPDKITGEMLKKVRKRMKNFHGKCGKLSDHHHH